RLGGMVMGTTATERIVVNEDSLWTGGEDPSGDYDHMGAYQCLGEIRINFPGHETVQNYRRDLDIWDATAHVRYSVGGADFAREIFDSHRAQVLVVRITADRPGSCTGSVEFHDSHGAETNANGNRLSAAGALSNGLKYDSQLAVVNQGGTVQAAEGKIVFSQC